MRFARIMLMLVLVLFAADVVQAAPAALLMQLENQIHPSELPCHMHQADQQQDSQPDGATPANCHACFACVNLLTAPAQMVASLPFQHVLMPHLQAVYQPHFSAPALRPPILT